MVCQYITKKGKTCNIKKVDEETQMCNKHIKNYLNRLNKTPKDDEIENKVEKKIEKKIEKKKEIYFDEDMDNELDKIINEENIEEDLYEENSENEEKDSPEVEKKKKQSKAFQLAMLTMAYNTCTSITERLAEPYLNNFSNQCAQDENIKNCLSELNDEQDLEIFMNATPDIKLLFFTGIIAVNKISTAIAIKSTSNIKTFEVTQEEEEKYKDL